MKAETRVVTLEEIKAILPTLDLVPVIEEGFVAYSAGRAVVPPVGELLLEGGDVHIKYGYIRGEPFYVVKIASGFYGNPALGLPSSNGLMLLFEQQTGQLRCVLLDEGRLTDARTAVAGAIVARRLAPGRVERIGIVGTGIQARQQLRFLGHLAPCQVLVWGRGRRQLAEYATDMAGGDPGTVQPGGHHDPGYRAAAVRRRSATGHPYHRRRQRHGRQARTGPGDPRPGRPGGGR
jgi:ornithine cyclodeaminase